MNIQIDIEQINRKFENSQPDEILGWAWSVFGKKASIGTSFQGAGIVVMHICKTHGYDFPVFTIDTGLLFPETIELKNQLENFLGITIKVLKPEITLEKQSEIYGEELWKHNPDLCCTIRKVLPLKEELSHLDCWITGLRRDQSQTRAGISILEVYEYDADQKKDVYKLNPLAGWSRDRVWQYIKQYNIPYNKLNDLGYKSIGCKPCTSPVLSGTNERAGRWIGFSKTECGIHTFMKKKI
jgi:phosphoadenosine phosphosulfate reductase